jgi:hypothetical protein
MFCGYIAALRVHHNWDQKSKRPEIKVGDFVLVPQHKVIKSRWPIARITKLIHDSTYGNVKAAMIEYYVANKINVKKRNLLFKRKRTADLTPEERRQVTGYFKPGDRAVLLEKLYPYEMWEEDQRFETPIVTESVPTNFPDHPVIDQTDLSKPMYEIDEKLVRKEKKKNERRIIAKQKRPLSPVIRDETKRPRREVANYNRNYNDLLGYSLTD